MSRNPAARRRRRMERGAVATIVAVMLGGGVLLGMTALAVDVGSLMFERRQLQNGADATAMALASACAKNISQCDDDQRLASLETLASGNAGDNSTQLDQEVYDQGQCGRVPTAPDMPPCTTGGDTADLTKCPDLPAWLTTGAGLNVPYVETYTKTLTSSGGDAVVSFFGMGESEVRSCARAAWGPPKSGSTIPFTFSYCEFQEATSNGTVYGVETSIALKYGKASECTTTPSGGDFSGGFGNLDHVGCVANTDANAWVDASTGIGAINDCGPNIDPGDTLYIPIFDCVSDTKTLCVPGNPTGTHTWYHIKGFAAFYVTAYDVTGQFKDSLPGFPKKPAEDECKAESKDNKCLYGMFVDDWVDTTGEIDPNGTDLGSTVVRPAG